MMRSECKARNDGMRVCKPQVEEGAEMRACFHKLKQLVPTVPHNRKLSKVQLLQHVIDYILDLEVELETNPLSSHLAAATHSAFLTTRLPLSEKIEQDTRLSTQVLWSSDDLSFTDCESRSLSK